VWFFPQHWQSAHEDAGMTGVSHQAQKPFLTARWHALLMLNYAVDPAILQPLVPTSTELDSWCGRTFVSVVAFRFLQTRVRGIGIPLHRDFDEINLRFYVRRMGPEGWRRGVAFVKEVVPRRGIAWVARLAYNENYVACPTRSTIELPGNDRRSTGRVAYRWTCRGSTMMTTAAIHGAPATPADDAVETFISEHYWGYSRQRHGDTMEYRVEHPRWRVWAATGATLSGDVGRFYGSVFRDVLRAPPSTAFVADGSNVAVYPGQVIP
jgi:uncharacterized protein